MENQKQNKPLKHSIFISNFKTQSSVRLCTNRRKIQLNVTKVLKKSLLKIGYVLRFIANQFFNDFSLEKYIYLFSMKVFCSPYVHRTQTHIKVCCC